MKDIINTLQIVVAAVGGYIGYFLGGWDGFLYALVAFVVIDYLTGIMVAILEKRLSSEVGFRGIFKKVLISRWWLWHTSWIRSLFKPAALSEPLSSSSICLMKASA
jgi:Phage-related holin (Lysis protein)